MPFTKLSQLHVSIHHPLLPFQEQPELAGTNWLSQRDEVSKWIHPRGTGSSCPLQLATTSWSMNHVTVTATRKGTGLAWLDLK